MKPSRGQSCVALLVFACVVALQMSPDLAAGGPGGENKESRTLTVTKECGTAMLAPGELSYCTITESNFRPLRGAKIRYFGPGFFTADHPFLDSWVVIESEQVAAVLRLATAWSGGYRMCWEPASSPAGVARSRGSRPT